MSRVRVLELAKELGIETKVALAKLQELGIQVKNHFNALSETDAARLRAFHRLGKNPEKEAAQKASAQKIFIRRKAVETSPPPPPEELSRPPVAETVVAAQTAPLSQDVEGESTPAPTLSFDAPSVQATAPGAVEVQGDTPLEEASTAERHAQPVDVKPAGQPPVAQTESEATALVDSQPSSSELPKKQEPKPSSEGAVIVRRAEIRPTPAAGPENRPSVRSQSYTTSGYNQQGGYRRDENRGPQRTATASSSSVVESWTPKGASSSPETSGAYGQRRPSPSSSPAMSRPYVTAEISTSASPLAPKGIPSRLKDRDKDRDKRKITEEENLQKHASRLKGGRDLDFDEDFIDFDAAEGDGANPGVASNVRTMIPNRKKNSAFSRKKEVRKAEAPNPTKLSKKVIRVDESISVNDLAGELSQKVAVVIKTLMKLGMMATVNQQIDFDTASFVATEFGFEVQSSSVSIGDILSQKTEKQQTAELLPRPPIVTIMGHVDHGKTSLLDAIRSTNVALKELGGITQHIGAYQIEYEGRKLTFLDTPGHEAFTAMRARGAQVTDVVVLVVAADDGVMPQTIEAIAHAKAAQVPIVVAVNKIDKPGSQLDRIYRELADQGVMPEEWGGESMFVQVSAKTRQGLNTLIESILLQADVLDLKAPQDGQAEGIVIEAKLDKARGPVTSVIVTKGILRQQDFVVVGRCMGRVRALHDATGQKISQAEPAMPVEIIGLDAVPAAGDQLNCVASDAIAKEAVAYRIEKQRKQDLMVSQRGTSSVEEVLAILGNTEEKAKEICLIVKADTQGSCEAIRSSIQKLDTAKVKTKVLHAAVGGITETDIILAKASNAFVVGFNVRPDRVAAQVAEQSGIRIQCFGIIYELLDAVQSAMVGVLSPTKLDKVVGHAEVRNIFSVPKVGTIAGCMVTDGKIIRNAHVRIIRDGIVGYSGRVGSLRRFKDDAKEVAQGFECGIGIENYNDVKVGDILEVYMIEEVAATLN